MQSRVFIPLLDLAFLTLGAIVAILSQTRMVTALPVEVTEIERGIAAVTRDDIVVITVTVDGLHVGTDRVALADLVGAVGDGRAMLRADRQVPTEALVRVMSVLARGGVEMRIEVEER